MSTLPHSYQPLAHPLAPAGALLGRRMSHFHLRRIGTHPQIRPSPLFPSLTSALAVAVVALRSSARERSVRGLRGWARRHFNPLRSDEFPTFFLFFGLTPLHGLFAILESPSVSIIFALPRRESVYRTPPFVYHYFMTFCCILFCQLVHCLHVDKR